MALILENVGKTFENTGQATLKNINLALRYAFFSSLPGLIATAHTQDDNLETVLLNLTRESFES